MFRFPPLDVVSHRSAVVAGLVSLAPIVGLTALPAAAQTWVGGGGTAGNWSTVSNWVGGVPNGLSADAVFNGGVTSTTARLDISAIIRSLTFNAGSSPTSFLVSALSAGGASTTNSLLLGAGGITNNTGAGVNQTVSSIISLISGTTIGSTVSGGSLVLAGQTGTAANAFNAVNLNSFNLTVTGSGNTAIHSPIQGNGNLIKTGAGTLTLTGASSYNGLTTVSGGTLLVNGTGALGILGINGLSLSGGQFGFLGGSNTISRAFALGGTGSGFVVSAGSDLTLTGALSGTGNLVKSGDGDLTLLGAATHTGGTIIQGGNVTVAQSLGTGPISIESGTLSFVGLATAGDVTITNSDSLVVQGAADLSTAALINEDGGKVDFTGADGASLGSLSGGGEVRIGSKTLYLGRLNQNDTFRGVIQGTGSLVKTGSGTLTLAKGYSGFAEVTGGVLNFGESGPGGSADTVRSGAFLIDRGGTLQFLGTSRSSPVRLFNDGLVRFRDSTTAGRADITNYGLTIFTDMSDAGTAAIQDEGKVIFAQSARGGSAVITLGLGGSVEFHDSASAENAFIESTTRIGQISFSEASSAGNASISSAGLLDFSEYASAGSATISNGYQLSFRDNASGGNAAVFNAVGAELTLAQGFGSPAFTLGSLTGSGTVNVGTRTLTVGSLGRSDTLGATLTGTNGRFIKTGTGTLTLTGISQLFGGLTVEGGTLAYRSDASLGGTGGVVPGPVLPTGGVTLTGGGTLRYDGNSALFNTARTLTLAGTGGAINVFSADTELTIGSVIRGTGGLTKSGAGTLALTGRNTFSGGVTLRDGTLVISDGAALGAGTLTLNGGTLKASSPLTLNNAVLLNGFTTLDTGAITGLPEPGYGLILNGPVTLAKGDLTLVGSARTLLNGTIGESAGESATLVKRGSGTLEIRGDNTYTGGTLVAAGTLIVNNAYQRTALGSGTGEGAVTVANGATLTGTYAISGPVQINRGGMLGVGNSIGQSTVGSLSLSGGSLLDFEIGDDGVTSDLLDIGGLFRRSSAGDITFRLGGPLSEGTFTLLTFGAQTGFTSTDFLASDLPQGWLTRFELTGSAVQPGALRVTLANETPVAPEPGSLALILVAIGIGAAGFWTGSAPTGRGKGC